MMLFEQFFAKVLVFLLLAYLLPAFVLMDMNPADWPAFSRFTFAGLGLLVAWNSPKTA